jgi:small subunit ribosomal protein S24e
MKLEILSEKENPVMKRKEIEVIIEHIESGTPTRKEIKEHLKALKDYPIELMVIKKIEGTFGLGKEKALIFVYDNEEIMKKVEPKYLFEREAEEQSE